MADKMAPVCGLSSVIDAVPCICAVLFDCFSYCLLMYSRQALLDLQSLVEDLLNFIHGGRRTLPLYLLSILHTSATTWLKELNVKGKGRVTGKSIRQL